MDPQVVDSSSAGGSLIGSLIYLVVLVAAIAGMWKTFAKAGHPGWAAIVPIYNFVVLLKIANKPLWWIVLFFIPLVNFVAAILIGIEVAKAFGKGTGFGIGLALLAPIFYAMLGFGDATYQGHGAAALAPAAA